MHVQEKAEDAPISGWLHNIYISLLEKGPTCLKDTGDSLHKQEMKAKVELSTFWLSAEGVS